MNRSFYELANGKGKNFAAVKVERSATFANLQHTSRSTENGQNQGSATPCYQFWSCDQAYNFQDGKMNKSSLDQNAGNIKYSLAAWQNQRDIQMNMARSFSDNTAQTEMCRRQPRMLVAKPLTDQVHALEPLQDPRLRIKRYRDHVAKTAPAAKKFIKNEPRTPGMIDRLFEIKVEIKN